jgi:hypothetical protein
MADINIQVGSGYYPARIAKSASGPHWMMEIGDCTLDMWPADPDAIRRLGKRLIEVADELEKE